MPSHCEFNRQFGISFGPGLLCVQLSIASLGRLLTKISTRRSDHSDSGTKRYGIFRYELWYTNPVIRFMPI